MMSILMLGKKELEPVYEDFMTETKVLIINRLSILEIAR